MCACQRGETELKFSNKILEYRDCFVDIALDSTDIEQLPSKLIQFYQRVHKLDLHCVAYVGEELYWTFTIKSILLLEKCICTKEKHLSVLIYLQWRAM